MTESEVLGKVKQYIGAIIEDEAVNAQIMLKLNAVIQYLNDGGAVIAFESITDKQICCVAMGVNDLLNSGSGATSFSPAFDIIAKQICGGNYVAETV